MIWPVVSATGHRPQHLSPAMREWLPAELVRVARKLRAEHSMEFGVSGMALGVDMWWARAILAAGCKLWAHVPFPQQPDVWHQAERDEWQSLLSCAAKITTYGNLNGTEGGARKALATRLLHQRNDGMRRVSSAIVAAWRPSKTDGGTASAFKKAKREHVPLIHLNPDAQSVHLIYTPPIGASTQ